jgi:adenosylhomocysteine nucleosidase
VNTGPHPFDLGLIVPTREEFDYLRQSIPCSPLPDDGTGFWYEFEIPGDRWGVVRALFDMGLTATTAAALNLLHEFDPELLVVMGIGGGLSESLRLGDVVVASAIQEYLKAAKTAPDQFGNTAFQSAGEQWPLTRKLRAFTENFEYVAQEQYQSWLRFARERSFNDDLPLTTTPGARREPRYFLMSMASGDLVVTDPAFRSWLLQRDRKQGVIEMEAAGAARAVTEFDENVALLVLRGISDFADERKAYLDATVSEQDSGVWRRYAVQNAVELLLAFLASPHFPWRRSIRRTAKPNSGGRDSRNRSFGRLQRAWGHFTLGAHGGLAGVVVVHKLPDPHAGPDQHGSDDEGPYANGSAAGPESGAVPGGHHQHDHAIGGESGEPERYVDPSGEPNNPSGGIIDPIHPWNLES